MSFFVIFIPRDISSTARRAVLGTTLDRVMLGAYNGLQPSFVTLVREAHDSAKLDPTPYDGTLMKV